MTVTVPDRPTPPEGLIVGAPPQEKKDAIELLWKRSRDDGGAPIEYYQVPNAFLRVTRVTFK